MATKPPRPPNLQIQSPLPTFEWGDKVTGTTDSYKSMKYRGQVYKLHDCVYIRSNTNVDHIAKLMRLFEEGGEQKIRVRWFIRGAEFAINITGVNRSDPKEVYIAQGNQRGVEDILVPNVILRKCKVLCTASCQGNPMPTQLHLEAADHYFNKVYSVADKKLVRLEKFCLKDKTLAKKFFNQEEWLPESESDDIEIADCSKKDASSSPTSVKDFDMEERTSEKRQRVC